ncbi:MAG TPA: IgGFc-binding protein, partial [Cytophagaceae bacterium]
GSTSSVLNSDIFVLKGQNGLGTDFFTPFQNFWDTDNNPDMSPTNVGWYQGDAHSTIDIIATEPGSTRVTVYPTQDVLISPGDTLRVTPGVTTIEFNLNQGQTYSIQAAYLSANKHLSASRINSTKKIAVTIKDDTVKEGAGKDKFDYGYDLIGDQILPVTEVGKEYIVMKGFLSIPGHDKVFIVPVERNGTTRLIINGVERSILSPGQSYTHSLETFADYILSDKPVYVFHVSGIDNELSGAQVPSVYCTGSRSVSFTRSTNEKFVMNILVKAGGENYFKLGNSSIPGTAFQDVPSSSGWKVARFDSDATSIFGIVPGQAYLLRNDSAFFHLGIMNGSKDNAARYGYFSDFGDLSLNLFSDNVNMCADSLITLNVNQSAYETVQWNGSAAGSFTPSISGPITLEVFDKRGCYAKEDIQINILPKANVRINQVDTSVCNNSLIRLTATSTSPNPKYTWKNGASGPSIDLVPSQDSVVIVRLVDGNNCRSADSVLVRYKSNFNFDLGNDKQTICSSGAFELNAGAGYDFYEWRNGPRGTTASTYSPPKVNGTYAVTVTKNGCTKSDSVQLTFINVLNVDLDKTPRFVCNDSSVTLRAGLGFDNYTWRNGPSGSSANSFNVVQRTNGYYKVSVKKGECTASDSVLVTFVPPLDANLNLKGNQVICEPGTITLVSNGDFDTYNWKNGPATKTYTPGRVNGTYVITVTKNGCPKTDSVNLTFVDPIAIGLDKTPKFVCTDSTITLRASTGYDNYTWT